ncbi:hypothetical protein P691DRAFT_735655 [Macrolepiota fuliginosa MF-IS2]|uniref:Nephrocystin 3-like N-terminal domain-containing protein n=1 Tax=Macrolepiota fuliginosa MF-IS2 TaxID=1400762 RepID=A0A9P6C0X9_9AGAR|nr:hypothetical protein P691DRAFT_735655 [Macrolepiota fuliginosa MF-IS2]
MKSGAGILSNANNVVIHQATMVDQSYNVQTQTPVLTVLFEKMTKGAGVDSSARWPPPKCFPGTRVKLTTKIQDWFLSHIHHWDFLWLSGPAGVGKSAVAQTVAEFAAENGILGAAYFFSRPNKRYKYIEVFITLAYQLAIYFPGYQHLISTKLAGQPDLVEKAPHIQFRALIVEPLLSLSHERKHVIILDGLDECDGEGAQIEIIELINDLVHSNISLPIIWMICSRPESHLKRIFARSDYSIQCWREFLPIDSAESRSDTETFIRGRLKEIHDRYGECVDEDANGSWPPEPATAQIVEKTSGLFVLADTLLKHIEDSETCNPDRRLGEVLVFFERSRVTGSRSPVHDLNLFYTHILSAIPGDDWPMTRQILLVSAFRTWGGRALAVQSMCNLLGITRARFYTAMRRLHSVLDIPEPSSAASACLRFFHTTFLDYLTDPHRAGRFFIGSPVNDYGIAVTTRLRDFVLLGLQRFGTTLSLSWVNKNRKEVQINQEASRALKASLSWSSGDIGADWASAQTAADHFFSNFFELFCVLLKYSELDDELLEVLRGFDFNVLPFIHDIYWLSSPLKYLDKLEPFSLVRVRSVSEWDQMLLSEVARQYPNVVPFDFGHPHEGGFFLLGDGTNSIGVVMDVQGQSTYFRYVFQKTPPQVWPVLQNTPIVWDEDSV